MATAGLCSEASPRRFRHARADALIGIAMRRTIILAFAVVLMAAVGCSPAQNEIAQALVDASYVPPRDASGVNGELGRRAFVEWVPNLIEAGISARDANLAAFDAIATPGLYADGTFQPELARQMGRRISNLPAATVQRWLDAVKEILPEEDRLNAVLQLIEIEPLWRGDTFVSDQEGVVLARLRSVPRTALDAWDHGRFAVPLLNVDALYDSNRFNVELFNRALPVATRLWEARSQVPPAS